MTKRLADRPYGAGHWGRAWGIHRNTARRLLRWIRGHYGPKVVWTVGPRKALVATAESLQVVRVFRAERNVILVMSSAPAEHDTAGVSATLAPRARVQARPVGFDESELVTQEQLSRALAEVWRVFGQLGHVRR